MELYTSFSSLLAPAHNLDEQDKKRDKSNYINQATQVFTHNIYL